MRADVPMSRAASRALQTRLPSDVPGSSNRELAGEVLQDLGLGMMLQGAGTAAAPVVKAGVRALERRALRRSVEEFIPRFNAAFDTFVGKNKEQRYSDELVDMFVREPSGDARKVLPSLDAFQIRGGHLYTELDPSGTYAHELLPGYVPNAIRRGMPVSPLRDVAVGERLPSNIRALRKLVTHDMLFVPEMRASFLGGVRQGSIRDVLERVDFPVSREDDAVDLLARLLARKAGGP